jgi:hypothetical protein
MAQLNALPDEIRHIEAVADAPPEISALSRWR